MSLGSPYLIGTATAAAGSATQVLTAAANTTAGDVIIVAASVNTPNTTAQPSGVTDSQGNTYVLAESSTNDSTGVPTYTYVAQNTTALVSGTSTITVTYSGSSPTTGSKNLIAIGCSGVAASGAVDQVNVTFSSTSAPTITSGTLTQASELCIGVCTNQSGGGLISWASPWTVLGTASASQLTSLATQNVSATTAVTASGTLTSAVHATIMIITLAASAVAAATTFSNNFEEGTSGTTITPANSAGTGQNAWTQVNGVSGGGTVAFDNTHAAHGSLSAKIATASGGSLASLRSTTLGTQAGPVYARGYFYFTALPTILTRLISYQTSGGTNCATAHINTNGTINIRDSTSAVVLTSTTIVPLNTWWRLELFITGGGSTGQCGFRLYTTQFDSVTADETQTSSATQAFTGSPGEYDFGVSVSTVSAGPYWLDDAALSSVGWIGPAAFLSSAAIALAGVAVAGAKRVAVAVSAASAFAGSVAGSKQVARAAAAATALNGSVAGSKRSSGASAAVVALSGAASSVKHSASAAVSAVVAFTANAGAIVFAGASSAVVALSGTVQGAKRVAGSVTAAMSLNAARTGNKSVAAGSAASVALAGVASAVGHSVRAAVSAVLALFGVATAPSSVPALDETTLTASVAEASYYSALVSANTYGAGIS